MSGTNRIVLDTNAIVALLRGDRTILQMLHSSEWIGVSVISKLEFLAFPRLSPNDESLFHQFLQDVTVVNIECEQQDYIQTIIDIRRRYPIKLPDAIVAATAIHNNASLITADRDFKSVDELTILSF